MIEERISNRLLLLVGEDDEFDNLGEGTLAYLDVLLDLGGGSLL